MLIHMKPRPLDGNGRTTTSLWTSGRLECSCTSLSWAARRSTPRGTAPPTGASSTLTYATPRYGHTFVTLACPPYPPVRCCAVLCCAVDCLVSVGFVSKHMEWIILDTHVLQVLLRIVCLWLAGPGPSQTSLSKSFEDGYRLYAP